MEQQIPFGDEAQLKLRVRVCPDCGIGIGGFHHPDCSIEQCPDCLDQLGVCPCEVEEQYHKVISNLWWTRLPPRTEELVANGS